MTQSNPSWRDRVTDYTAKLGNLNVMTGLIATQNLFETSKANRKNQAAENDFVRQSLWKAKADPGSEDDDMSNLIAGDYQHTVTYQQSQPSLLSKAIGPLLMAAGLGTAGYFVADAIKNRPVAEQPAPVEHTDTDTDTTVTLDLPDPADF